MQDYSNGQFTSLVYYLFDAHGNVVNLIDNDGEKIKTYRYDAFGVEKNPDENDTNPFRYCGEYFDKETGTIYLRARSYDPSIGRFTQRDSYTGSASDPLSLNLYTYCANNPLLYVDPSGHSYGTLPDGTKMSINSNWDAQLFYQKYNMQNAKLNPTSSTDSSDSSSKVPTNATFTQLDTYATRLEHLGIACDFTNKTSRNIWMLSGDDMETKQLLLNEFNNNSDFENDILIIDTSDPSYTNYQVYDSYKYQDYQLLDETIDLIKKYNDDLNRSDWKRTSKALHFEWLWHNALYNVPDPWFKEQARSADLDQYANGSFYIK